MKLLFEGKLTTKSPLERSIEAVVGRQAAIARFMVSASQRHTAEDMKKVLDIFWEAYEELGTVAENLEYTLDTYGATAVKKYCEDSANGKL